MAKERTPEPPTERPTEGPPDLLILDQHTGYSQNGTLRSWKGGVPITNPAHIADLAKMPGKRYRLIK